MHGEPMSLMYVSFALHVSEPSKRSIWRTGKSIAPKLLHPQHKMWKWWKPKPEHWGWRQIAKSQQGWDPPCCSLKIGVLHASQTFCKAEQLTLPWEPARWPLNGKAGHPKLVPQAGLLTLVTKRGRGKSRQVFAGSRKSAAGSLQHFCL